MTASFVLYRTCESVMLGLQLLTVTTQLAAVVVSSVGVSLDDVDAVSCLTARSHCVSDATCRQRLERIHDVCGDNSKPYVLSALITTAVCLRFLQ